MNPVLAVPRVDKASAAQADQVVQTLAAGFFDDPIFRWWIPDDERRRELLPSVFVPFAEVLMAHDETYLTADGRGAALWVPPGGELVAEEDAEEFVGRVVEAAGADAEERTLGIMGHLDEHHPHGSFYFLNLLAVVPEAQGQGLGSAMLERVLDRCDREGVAGLPGRDQRARQGAVRAPRLRRRGRPTGPTAPRPSTRCGASRHNLGAGTAQQLAAPYARC